MKDNDNAFPAVDSHIDEYGNVQIDCIAYGMTLPQYAAIHLKVPMSGDPELDKMIRESRRLDLAGQALTGFCSGPDELPHPKRASEWCCETADALLAEWEEEAGK
jgi:hypothetical protein